MASCYTMSIVKLVLLLLTTFALLQYTAVDCFEYQVGGDKGWVVPPSNDTRIYNDWASENRFLVGDAIHFKYKKDTVMEVTEEDYKRCNSSHPKFFSNNGNTVYKLNHPGSHYFISGASGHCEMGQKMIIKVMSSEDNDDASSQGGSSKKSSASPDAMLTTKLSLFLPLVSYITSFVIY